MNRIKIKSPPNIKKYTWKYGNRVCQISETSETLYIKTVLVHICTVIRK